MKAIWISGACALMVAGIWSCGSTDGRDAARNLRDQPAVQSCVEQENAVGPAGAVPVHAEKLVTGLEVPWAIAFLPGTAADFLVTERPGRVRLVKDGKLVETPVLTVTTGETGEGGLMGLALHPDFASNSKFYIYYTGTKDGANVNRLERYTLAADRASAALDQVIFDDLPASARHDGGRLRIGPDRNLYLGTGDATQPELAQNPKSYAGKLLRFTADGGIPADNPIPGSAIYMSGIRNVEGFDWVDGETMMISDHGPSGELGRSGHDEVTFARAGANLGWPTIYGCEPGEGLLTPSITWTPAVPPGGAIIYKGDAIPEWKGSILIASLLSKDLVRIAFDPASNFAITTNESYFTNTYGRLRELVQAPDGSLYVTTSNCDGRGTCGADKDVVLRVTK